jgi:transposase InsO family protein
MGAEELVERDFTATRPSELWAADITYVRTPRAGSTRRFVLDGSRRREQGGEGRTIAARAKPRRNCVLAAVWSSTAVVRALGGGARRHGVGGRQSQVDADCGARVVGVYAYQVDDVVDEQ